MNGLGGTVAQFIQLTESQGVLTVRLQRPEKRNALNGEMYAALVGALTTAQDDPRIRVIVLTGSNGNFCSGNDIDEFLSAQHPPSVLSIAARFTDALAACELPLLATVDGAAVGLGATLLLHCDAVFATRRSRFSMPFVTLGLVPEAGSSILLAEAVGPRLAARMLFFGETLSGNQAYEAGFVSELADDANSLQDMVDSRATALAALPGQAVLATKRLLNERSARVRAAIERERVELTYLFQSPSTRSTLSAVRAKLRERNGLDD